MGPQGPRGDEGDDGSRGRQGPPGPQGPPGQSLVFYGFDSASERTVPNIGNSGGPSIDGEADDNPSTDATTDGTELARYTIEEPGRYLVQGVAQFFDWSGEFEAADAYGVVWVWVDGQIADDRDAWTADLPSDGNNGAQTSWAFELVVDEAPVDVVVMGGIRTDTPPDASQQGNAGAQLLITRIQ